jgi:hypothetical protein
VKKVDLDGELARGGFSGHTPLLWRRDPTPNVPLATLIVAVVRLLGRLRAGGRRRRCSATEGAASLDSDAIIP